MDLSNIIWIDFSKYYDIIIWWILSYSPKIIWAILVLWIWFKIISFIRRLLENIMIKQRLDPMLKSFLSSFLNIILKILVIISAAWMLGIQTSSFIAMLAAAWLAIWLALKWTLQNFASWVMILFLRPFKIWDFIEISSSLTWKVKEIHIFNSIIITADRKKIIIPNSDIMSAPIINYTGERKRRIDLIIWISYNDDIDKAKKILDNIAKSDERIFYKDWVTIWVKELWADSVNFDFRFFVKSNEYWDVYRNILEIVKKTFDKEWLNFPYPQRDIHLYNEK